MASFARFRSSRVHPDGGAGEKTLPRMESQKSFKRSASGKTGAMADADAALQMTDEEHAEWLDKKVREDGLKATKEALSFFGTMLLPISVVTLWTFSIFAIFSWTILNVLCNGIAKQNSGSLVFGECIYINTGGKGYRANWGQKTFFLVYWSIQNVWMAGVCGYMTYIIFGPAFRRCERIFVAITAFLCMFISPICGPRFGMSMSNMWIVLGVAIASNANMVVTANAPVRYTVNPLMKYRWVNMQLLSGFVANIYLLVMPLAITARSSDSMGGIGLTILRLVVHPLMWSIIVMSYRFTLRHCGYIPDMRGSILLCWPMLYQSMYGRFLLLQMNSMSSVVITNIVLACVDMCDRITDRCEDGLYLKMLYGEKVRDAMTAVRDTDDKRTNEVYISTMMEMLSIFCASAILSFGGVASSPGQLPQHMLIWVNAVLQAATLLLFAFMGMVLEGKFHNFEWRRSFTKGWATWRLVLYILFMELVGGSRLCLELVGIFCPTYYPDRDILLLEQCDKPSLFQAITFSSANSFKMIGSYFNLNSGIFNATTGGSINSM